MSDKFLYAPKSETGTNFGRWVQSGGFIVGNGTTRTVTLDFSITNSFPPKRDETTEDPFRVEVKYWNGIEHVIETVILPPGGGSHTITIGEGISTVGVRANSFGGAALTQEIRMYNDDGVEFFDPDAQGIMELGGNDTYAEWFDNLLEDLMDGWDFPDFPTWLQDLPIWNIPGFNGIAALLFGGGLDPLVFDLNGNGQIDLVSIDNSNVYFDFWNDGYAEATGWVGATDGMLVWDIDASGDINSVAEMFGSNYPIGYITEVDWSQFESEEHGFARLALHDLVANGGNNDGVIDSNDDIWSELKIWQDLNQDGVSQSSELLTLAQLGITEIDVSNYILDSFVGISSGGFTRVIEGNTVTHSGNFTINGVEREVVDVWFNTNLQNTYYSEDYDIDERVYFLPTLRGYGQIADLYIAMSQDESLLDDVETFSTARTFTEMFDEFVDVRSEVRDILFKWAGIDENAAPQYDRHGVFDAFSEFMFLRKFTGQNSEFLGTWFDMTSALPMTGEGVESIFDSWNMILDAYTARLVFQSGGHALFDTGVSYNPFTDAFEGTFALSQGAIDDLETEVMGHANIEGFWHSVAAFIENTMGISNLSVGEIASLNDAIDDSSSGALDWNDIVATLSDNLITGTSGNDTINGTQWDDVIEGLDGDNTLNGGLGNDRITGWGGADTLDGGAGNDILNGGDGNDTYKYNSGHDVIIEAEGNAPILNTDIIEFAAGIAPGDVTLHIARLDAATMHVFLNIEGRGTITLQYFTVGSAQADNYIDELHFAGSIVVNSDELIPHFHGTNADDAYISDGAWVSSDKAYLYGHAGNDSLASAGNQEVVFDGGEGDDFIEGGYNTDDTYVVSQGNDLVNFSGGGNDTIYVPEGYTLDDVSFYRVMYGDPANGQTRDAKIVVDGLGSITIHNQFEDNSLYYVPKLKFFDNSTLDLADQEYITIGTDGDDYFGNTASGWVNKDDTILFGQGDDVVWEDAGSDTLLFEAGVTLSSLTLRNFQSILPQGWNGKHLVVSDQNGNSFTVVNHFDYTSDYRWEKLKFANGAIINISDLEIETHGTTGDDTLTGTDQGDKSSNDTLYGYAGNDYLYGGAGNDLIDGGANNDTIDGGSEIDTVSYATAASAVTVNLATTTGQNTGGAGTDTITNVENIIGSAFNDTLTGNGSANTIEGGAGNDIINGAGGTDAVSYANAASAVTVNLATTTGQNTGGAGTDTITNTENLIGSAFNDTLTGSTGNNVIEGGAGNDTINGAAGTDTLTYANATSGITISLALTTGQNTGGAGTDTVSNFENLTGSAFNDILTGSTAANTISGGDGNDIIEGGAGNDTLTGGNGTDTLSYQNAGSAITLNLATTSSQNTGGAGSDTQSGFENLRGSAFNDTLTGNGSNNVIEGGAGNDAINGAGGTDTVSYANAGSAVTVNLTTTTGQNTGGAGTDTITNTENLTGSAFNDTLSGNSGNNVIEGGSGNDTINGNGGADTIKGGLGTDTLYGNAAADTFIFEAASAFVNQDTIADFNTGQADIINIADLLIGYSPGQNAIDDFVTFTTVGSNSTMSVDRDGTGTTYSAQAVASITGVTGLDADTLLANGNLIAA